MSWCTSGNLASAVLADEQRVVKCECAAPCAFPGAGGGVSGLVQTRKKQDLYLWVSKVPNGPSAKFHVSAGEQGSILACNSSHSCHCCYCTHAQQVPLVGEQTLSHTPNVQCRDPSCPCLSRVPGVPGHVHVCQPFLEPLAAPRAEVCPYLSLSPGVPGCAPVQSTRWRS